MAEEINFDPARPWMEHPGKACAKLSLDEAMNTFFAGPDAIVKNVGPRVVAAWNRAKDICDTCPVLAPCRRDTLGEPAGVWGGRDAVERASARKALSARAAKWSPEFRAQVAEQIYLLRHETRDTRDFQEIKLITGINSGLAHRLYDEEAERRKASREARDAAWAAQAPREEPEGLSLPDLPEEPGKRHLWAIHMGVVRDAHYLAHSRDGTHVYVELRDSMAMTRTWLPLGRVRFYTDPERVTKPMKGRKAYGVKAKRDFDEAA